MASGRAPRNHRSVPEDLFPGWNGDWKEWFTVMRSTPSSGFEKRESSAGELLGYKASLETMKKYFSKVDDGIYEWRKIAPRGGNVEVLYVGKTSSKPNDSLLRRVQCYTRYRSHERENINKVLAEGCHLQVRVLSSKTTKVTPERMETRALKAYRYPWNDMNQAG